MQQGAWWRGAVAGTLQWAEVSRLDNTAENFFISVRPFANAAVRFVHHCHPSVLHERGHHSRVGQPTKGGGARPAAIPVWNSLHRGQTGRE